MPLRQPLVLLQRSTALLGLLLLALVGLFAWSSWRAVKADQLLQMRTVVELAEKATDRYFTQQRLALADLAEDIQEGSGMADLVRVQRLLSAFKNQHAELLAVNLLRLDGQVLATSRTTSLVGLPTTAGQRNYPAIVAGLKPEVPMEVSPPLHGPVSGQWILPLRYTVRDAQGQARAFIVASVPIELLQSFWSDAPITRQITIALLRDDGFLVSRYPVPPNTPYEAIYGTPRLGVTFRALRDQGFPQRGQIEGPSALTGENFANVFLRLEHFPITVFAGVTASRLHALWWERSQTPLLLAAVLALAGLAGFQTLGRREKAWRAERLQAEARLRASEAFLERTGEVAGIGGWSFDPQTRQTAWSSQTYRIHEVGPQHRPDLERDIRFYALSAQPVLRQALQQALEHGTPWDLELPFVTDLGRAIWVRVLGAVEPEGERPRRLVGALQDITEYRQRRAELKQEQALRLQAEQHAQTLDALLEERGEMLDVLAHEVRQPLHNASAALQSATAVLSEIGDREAGARLQRAHAVLNQVTGSIDNTLAVASLLARPDPIRREDTDIDMLLAVAVADMPPAQRGRVVVERLSATRTASVDMSLVRLALRNLIVNALRHGPPSTPVTIRVDDSDDPLALLIDVADQGPGVAAELEGRLFERGAHGGASGGHGLGLYIVQRVMELHAGRVLLLHNRPGEVVFRLMFEEHTGD